MTDALGAWLEKLEKTHVPALNSSLELLTRLAADENVAIERLAHVAQRDPGVTLRLFRHINSLRRRHLTNEITTVQHGLMMLGLGQVRDVIATIPVDLRLKPPLRERLHRLFARAFHGAWQAREWSAMHKDLEPDEAFTAALLHPLAEMLLSMYAPSKVEKVDQLMHQRGMEPSDAQYVVFGFRFDELSRQLAVRWQLPSLLVDSLHPENAERDRVYGVMLASQLARQAERDWYGPETTGIIDQVSDHLPRSFGVTASLVHRLAAEAARESPPLLVRPAAARLLLPGKPEAEPGWQPAPRVANGDRPEAVDDVPEEEIGEFCLAPRLDVLRNVLRRLNACGSDATLHTVLDLVLKGMHEGCGLNRVVFALLTPERDRLRTRAVVGAENDAHFSRFQVDLDDKNLFARLMGKPQAIWVDRKNSTKFLAMLPARVRETIDSETFYAMSVFVNERPVGMFYADRHLPYCRLDPRGYHRFKQLAQAAGKAMGKIVRK